MQVGHRQPTALAHSCRLAKIRAHLPFLHLGIEDLQDRPFLQQIPADADRRRFARVVGVGLEGKAEHTDALAAHRAKQLGDYQPSDALLLPGVKHHHALPVSRHLLEAVVAAEVHKVEDVLLEAAATKTRPGLEKLGANAAISSDRPGHLAYLGAGGLTHGRDCIDRTDPLGQEGVGGEFG